VPLQPPRYNFGFLSPGSSFKHHIITNWISLPEEVVSPPIASRVLD
jgi:hypothetical protein